MKILHMADDEYFEKAKKRFWAKVEKRGEDECWEWQACLHPKGYGQFNFNGLPTRWAHRIAWILTYGPIPEGLNVCHRHDNPPCCNPKHLFLGSQKENMEDCARKERIKQKLTKKDIIEIRRKYTIEGEPQPRIAKQFGINRRTVSQIVAGERWTWVKYLPSEGKKKPRTKLSDEDVRSIRTQHAAGGITKKELGGIYCVDPSTISRIISMQSRRGVTI